MKLFLSLLPVYFLQRLIPLLKIQLLPQTKQLQFKALNSKPTLILQYLLVGQFDLKHCGLQAEEQLKPITNFMVVKIDNEIYFYMNESNKIRDDKK